MAQSFENFDKPYRRGLVLGLSLAEVFLILLFLLLLASIGLTSALQEDLVQKQEENQELRDSLMAFKEVIGGKITIEEFTRLQKDAAAKQKLIRENEELTDQLAQATEKLEEVEEVIKTLEENNIQPKDLAKIISGKDTLARALSEKEKVEKKLEQVEKQKAELAQKLMIAEAQKELAESQLNETKDLLIKTAKTLDSIKDKGRNPPCWFRLVSDAKSGPGKKRQKDVKLFDIKIEDNGFYVIKHNNDNTPRPIDFGNQEQLPPYPKEFLNKKLNSGQFKKAFYPFFEAGEANKIQPYKCVFTVDVYDYTSATNKEGYKTNLKLVKELFINYNETSKWPLR